jgi:hypothetical protein
MLGFNRKARKGLLKERQEKALILSSLRSLRPLATAEIWPLR